MVIEDIGSFTQKPSKPLLAALMDSAKTDGGDNDDNDNNSNSNTPDDGKSNRKSANVSSRSASPRSNKTSSSNAARELLYEEATSCEDDADDAEESGQDEEGECDYTAQGEDLLNNEEYDNNELLGKYDDKNRERLDQYDLDDDFIDDRSEDDYSIVKSDCDTSRPVKRTRGGRIDRRHLVERDDSDIELDSEIPRYSRAHKRALSADSEDEPTPARIAKRRTCVIEYDDEDESGDGDDDDDDDDDDPPVTITKLSPRKAKETGVGRLSHKTKTSRKKQQDKRKQHKEENLKGTLTPSCSSDFDANKTAKQRSNKRRRGLVQHSRGKRQTKSPSFDSDSDASHSESKCASPKIKRRAPSSTTEDESTNRAGESQHPAEDPVSHVESDGDLEDIADFFGPIFAM
ncbi:nuclease HARBI1 [Sarotherodon galilaeus]